MIVWQFATIAALIGVLVISVMVLTNRLGVTNALLKRIEEGIVRPQPVSEKVPAAAEPAPVELAPAAAEPAENEVPAAEVADRDRRVSYLTVRDLKVISRSGRSSSDTPTAVSPLFNEVFGRRQEQPEPGQPPAEDSESSMVAAHEPVGGSIASHETEVEELAVATYEIRDFLDTTPAAEVAVLEAEPTTAETVAAVYEAVAVSEPEAVDAAAREEKRRRDLLIHAQRRRRRLR